MRCAWGVSVNGRTNVCPGHAQNVQPTKSNSPQVFGNKVKENLYNPAVRRQSGTRRGRGLALRGRVLAQEGGDGAGLGDLLGQRTFHVFDGRVSAGVQQELHDVGKLARRCCRKVHKRSRTAKFRQAADRRAQRRERSYRNL